MRTLSVLLKQSSCISHHLFWRPFSFSNLQIANYQYLHFFPNIASSLKAGFTYDACLFHSSHYNILKPFQLRHINAFSKPKQVPPAKCIKRVTHKKSINNFYAKDRMFIILGRITFNLKKFSKR